MSSELHTENAFNWKSLCWILLYFCSFSTALQIAIAVYDYNGTMRLRDSLLYSCLWLIPVLIFPNNTRLIAAITGAVLWLSSVLAMAYFVLYGQEFSQSVLFALFESNTSEAGEFLHQYFSVKLLVVVIIYTSMVIFLWSKTRPVYIKKPWRYIIAFSILYTLILHPLLNSVYLKKNSVDTAIAHLNVRMEPAAPWQIISNYVLYREQLTSLKKIVAENNAPKTLNNFRDRSGNEPRTLVLVIGESTQRNRMSLYGYPRKTTPNLDLLRDNDPNFTLFNDVVTPRPYTIETLQQVLTFANQENPGLHLTRPSLMNMMKQAGYKTFWITNHQTNSQSNTMLTFFSRQVDNQYYMNHLRGRNERSYDTVVLTPFKEVLADPAPKKFIVVHLLGTHVKYKFRYPEGEGIFDNNQEHVPAGLNQDMLETYNDYDSANVHNDKVLSQLIASYRATDPNGFMLYFSDHGEEVYDTPPHHVHGRSEVTPTRAMYEVPFFIWTSDKWQATHPRNLHRYVDRKYSQMDLIHTWSDLAGLEYDGYDPSRSVVSPEFKPVTRWIGDPYQQNSLHDFDKLFGVAPAQLTTQ